MILTSYVLVTLIGLCVGYFLKVHVAGLTFFKDICCFVFNGFFGFLHAGVCKYEDLLFVGDVSSLIDEYPLVLWLALIAMFVQVWLAPFKTYRSTYR